MSWSVSGEITKENAANEIMKLSVTYPIGEGAGFQFLKAKEAAIELISSGAAKGQKFGVSLSGHCQSDAPDSATDSLTISVYARSAG